MDRQKFTDVAFIQFHSKEARDRVAKVIRESELAKGLKSAAGSPLTVSKTKRILIFSLELIFWLYRSGGGSR